MRTTMVTDPERIVNSAVWAVYGDALGFISEGVDERGLDRRLDGHDFDTVHWVRKVSRFSPDIALPAGLYSDDTQLRLATSRAIRPDGSFDVESFSRIELPSWLDYHLGAGLGTLSAAKRLRSGTPWTALVSGDKEGRYVKGGGNGAAMRIQPLVWSASPDDDKRCLQSIVLNTACTHGHPKAFVGALFHGLMLRQTLQDGEMPNSEIAGLLVEKVDECLSFVKEGPEFGASWITEWNRSTASSFESVWQDACKEIRGTIAAIPRSPDPRGQKGLYKDFLSSVGLLSDAERGVATKTAVAAFAAITLLSSMSPRSVIQHVANSLKSDTDSIATMAGALLGACRQEECDSDIVDKPYIVAEARRNALIAAGSSRASSFKYDKIKAEAGQVAVGNLSLASPTSSRMGKPSAKESYQWCLLPFGQTVLLRATSSRSSAEPSLFEAGARDEADRPTRKSGEEPFRDPVAIARTLADGDFDALRIGRYLLNCARYPHGEGLAASIAYEVVKMFRDRPQKVTDRSVREEQKRIQEPAAPPAVMQLQLRATQTEKGSLVAGRLSNYGHRTASNIVLALGSNGTSTRMEIERLGEDESCAIERVMDLTIDNGTPIVVSYVSDGATYQQRGRFEPAVGHADTLLLKGLDIAQAIR